MTKYLSIPSFVGVAMFRDYSKLYMEAAVAVLEGPRGARNQTQALGLER